MREPMSRVWLTFRDPGLERAYGAYVARTSLRTIQFCGVLALAGLIGAYLSDPMTFGRDNYQLMHQARIFVMFPVTSFCVVVSFRPRAIRWVAVLGLVNIVNVIGTPAVVCMFIPEPRQFDVASAYISVVTVLVASAVVIPLGMRYVVATTALSVTPLLILAAMWPDITGAAFGWLWFAAFMTVFAGYFVNLRDREAFAAQYRLDEERERSERLLRNVLPAAVAERLKAGEARIADRFDHATVLFADLVGFTAIATKMPPEALVAALDDVFSAFDDIAARHGLEKIKTIGDAYMVVGGVPAPRDDHAAAVAQMALEMRAVVEGKQLDGQRVEIRIGLHSGPLVAGVIGKQKFIYDLWGDTVNTASRMESSGVPSGIQVTAATEALLRGRFTLEPRGKVSVKGKGDLETWMLVR